MTLNSKKDCANSRKLEHEIEVSVVVPIYNCADHLKSFYQSLLEQTFSSFEIIFVNDFSTDSSLKIINGLAENAESVRIISLTENLGSGVARNIGLQNSLGKYICFFDADDVVDHRFLDVMVSVIRKSDADIVVCNYNSVSDGNHEVLKTSSFKANEFNGTQALQIFAQNLYNPAPWNKIYKKELFENNRIEFPDKIALQDFAVLPILTERASKIVVIQDVLYNYVQNLSGISLTARDIHTFSIFKAFEIIFSHFSEFAPDQLKSDFFRQIVVGRFRYNLKLRYAKFSKRQLKIYITHFVNYYSSHNWAPHKIEKSDQALINFLKKGKIDPNQTKLILKLDSVWIELFNSEKKYQLANKCSSILKKKGAKFKSDILKLINRKIT